MGVKLPAFGPASDLTRYIKSHFRKIACACTCSMLSSLGVVVGYKSSFQIVLKNKKRLRHREGLSRKRKRLRQREGFYINKKDACGCWWARSPDRQARQIGRNSPDWPARQIVRNPPDRHARQIARNPADRPAPDRCQLDQRVAGLSYRLTIQFSALAPIEFGETQINVLPRQA